MKFEYFEIFKNCHFSIGDSGKTVGVIEKMRPEVTSAARNLPENVFS